MSKTRTSIRKRYLLAYTNLATRKRTEFDDLSRVSQFVKFEKIPIGKVEANKAPRLIQHRTYEYCYLLKKYIGRYSEFLRDSTAQLDGQLVKTHYMKLYRNREQASLLRESWDSFVDPVAIGLDGENFDSTIYAETLMEEHKFWNRLFNSRRLSRLLHQQLKNRCYSQHGLRSTIKGTRCSGEYTTSDGNSTINICGIRTVLGDLSPRAKVHVNGDDSVVIMERRDADIFATRLEQFKSIGMRMKLEFKTDMFQQISFCQSSPIRISGQWQLVKEPFRSMSRISYTDAKFANCIDRFMSGIGLCELACNSGVPILQSMALWILTVSGHEKPLACVNKNPAASIGNEPVVADITLQAREDFEVAFGVPIAVQLQYENEVFGEGKINPLFLSKYKNFIGNAKSTKNPDLEEDPRSQAA